MRHIISESSIEKIMNIYFKTEFDESVLEVRDNLGEDWYGLWSPSGVLMIGAPANDDSGVWFYNGNYFDSEWNVFGIDHNMFAEYMQDYLNSEYDLDIKRVM